MIIEINKLEISNMYIKYLVVMNKQEYNNIIVENSYNISDFNNVVNLDNFYFVFVYNFKNYCF